MFHARTFAAGSGRRRAVGFVAAVALSMTGVVALSTAPAFADSGTIGSSLSGSGAVGSETYSFTSGALSGSATFSASAEWGQPAAIALCPPVAEALEAMKARGATHALVSGSGPTVFGLFPGEAGVAHAQAAAIALRSRHPGAVAATPVGRVFAEPRET